MIEIRRLIIIGYSELALKLYRIYSKSFKVEIIYSERELKEFGKKIKVLKNYKIYLVKNIDKYLMKFERKNIFIFSLGSTFIFKKIIDKFKIEFSIVTTLIYLNGKVVVTFHIGS